VTHHEFDVDEHLDLVMALRILSTPTVVVLGPDGVPVARASGAMTAAQARTALGHATQDRAAQDRAAQDRAAQDRAAQDRAAQDRAVQDRAVQSPEPLPQAVTV
jgi:thioredoxin-like negative regulator of GroEL